MYDLVSRLEGRMESSGVTCPDMESLVESTESRVDCVPLVATSLMDLSPKKSDGGLCTGRRRFVSCLKTFIQWYHRHGVQRYSNRVDWRPQGGLVRTARG